MLEGCEDRNGITLITFFNNIKLDYVFRMAMEVAGKGGSRENSENVWPRQELTLEFVRNDQIYRYYLNVSEWN